MNRLTLTPVYALTILNIFRVHRWNCRSHALSILNVLYLRQQRKHKHGLTQNAPEFVAVNQDRNVLSETNELAKLLAKKQLIPTRLSTFDDVPGHYFVLKSTFENVTDELGASTMESKY